MIVFLIFISALFGIGRFFVSGHVLTVPGTYETFAHIWSGFLLAVAMPEFAWVFSSAKSLLRHTPIPPMPPTKGAAGFSVLIISMIELYMFNYQGWLAATFG
ncbi:hypothetical protein ACFOLJ_23920 [Rugamonas sp. CCM 8940]|uniref:hypothetical protein n=1 Tax=Rugamonas sp. CCM 8940 TaxID=2765359 RepID=UPI0018F30E1F|nr:hypothetical protein [Rugamonas sp. CCM 8940]MBJ7313503.1 hypothetical protein [Rugamonas sp. CCM 8940]